MSLPGCQAHRLTQAFHVLYSMRTESWSQMRQTSPHTWARCNMRSCIKRRDDEDSSNRATCWYQTRQKQVEGIYRTSR